MLATVLFLGFWVVLAFGLFFVAARGGLAGARDTLQTQSRGGRKAVSTIFVFFFVGFGVVLPVVFLLGNHSHASARIGEVKLTAAEKRGRNLYAENCGVCHTLAAASSYGKVGPNLDSLQPPKSLVLHTLENGCLPNAPANSPQTCLGYGVMPAGIVQGRDARDVSDFVARVAGK